MKLKYIVIDCMGHEVMIVFHIMINHSDVACGLGAISAGFISAGYGCYGESKSLKLESRGQTDWRIFQSSYGKFITEFS